MSVFSVEVFAIECDDCGNSLVEPADGYESEEDALDRAYYNGAIQIEDEIFCEPCAEYYSMCEWCDVRTKEDDSIFCEDLNGSFCYDSCIEEAHARHDKEGAELFGTTCESCGTPYGKTLNNTWQVKDRLPGFVAEKEAS